MPDSDDDQETVLLHTNPRYDAEMLNINIVYATGAHARTTHNKNTQLSLNLFKPQFIL